MPFEAADYVRANRKMIAQTTYDMAMVNNIFHAINLSNGFGKGGKEYPAIEKMFNIEVIEQINEESKELSEDEYINMRIAQVKSKRMQMDVQKLMNQKKEDLSNG